MRAKQSSRLHEAAAITPSIELRVRITGGAERKAMIFPGLALFLAVIAVNLIGDRLSQVLDPRSKETR
jgi:hypothetical protein